MGMSAWMRAELQTRCGASAAEAPDKVFVCFDDGREWNLCLNPRDGAPHRGRAATHGHRAAR